MLPDEQTFSARISHPLIQGQHRAMDYAGGANQRARRRLGQRSSGERSTLTCTPHKEALLRSPPHRLKLPSRHAWRGRSGICGDDMEVLTSTLGRGPSRSENNDGWQAFWKTPTRGVVNILVGNMLMDPTGCLLRWLFSRDLHVSA